MEFFGIVNLALLEFGMKNKDLKVVIIWDLKNINRIIFRFAHV